MEFTVEDISPVRKKIIIEVAPEEVGAALGAALALYKKDVQMDGFRKGKIPNSVLEKRYGASIEKQARENLINVHINDVMGKTGLSPLGRLNMEGDDQPLKKGEPFKYSMEFEVLPSFQLPVYEGLDVEQEDVAADDAMVDTLVQRACERQARFVPIGENRAGRDGEVAVVDFDVILDGKVVDQYRASNVDVEIGARQALPDFENLLKTIPVGHTGEGEVRFPEDFIAPELAGKTATLKVTVHAVKERQIPVPDDSVAQAAGAKDLASLRDRLRNSFNTSMRGLYKANTQARLLESLLKQVDFELPPEMVHAEQVFLLEDRVSRMERMGKAVARNEEQLRKIMDELKPDAERLARQKVFLTTVAKKENLEVTPEEVAREAYKGALQVGKDFKDYYHTLEESGFIFKLRENMLCDKAMDLIYSRANVQMVPLKKEAAPEEGDTCAKPAEAAPEQGESCARAQDDAPAQAEESAATQAPADNCENK